MAKPPGLPPDARKTRQQGSEFWVVGDRRRVLRDVYHTFLRLRWSATLALIGVAFFLANVGFGILYYLTGGVAGTDGSFFDAVQFSVETMATVGYGVMHPVGTAARIIMIVESIVGLIVTALATGLVFAKFSRPSTRIAFSANAVITTHDRKRSLIFRVGNRRSNVIVEAQLHVSVVTTTRTAEGETFYKAQDLKLVRDRQVGMTRGWTVFHTIDDSSPLFGLATEEALRRAELEIYISLTGIDDVTTQTVHAMHSYQDHHVKIDHHFADTLTELSDGSYLVDLSKFDVVIPDSTPRASVPA